MQEGPLGKSVASIAKKLDLTVTAVREWVSRAGGTATAPAGAGRDGGAVTAREQKLLNEIRVLKMQRDILKNAAPFSAKEST